MRNFFCNSRAEFLRDDLLNRFTVVDFDTFSPRNVELSRVKAKLVFSSDWFGTDEAFALQSHEWTARK